MTETIQIKAVTVRGDKRLGISGLHPAYATAPFDHEIQPNADPNDYKDGEVVARIEYDAEAERVVGWEWASESASLGDTDE